MAQGGRGHPGGDRAYLPHSRSRVSNDNLQFDTTIAPLVSVLDLGQNLHIRRELLGLDAIDRPVGMPFAVDFSPDGRTLYVVNSGSNDLSVIDLEIGLGLGHLELGANPRGIVVTADGTQAYISNSLSYSISIVDLDSLEVIDEIPVSRSPLPPDVQRGKEIFFSSDTSDIARDQWISCAACRKKPDTGSKFQVITADLIVEVLGTSFNVHSRGSQTNVYLEEGRIRVDLGHEEKYLDPGELIEYSAKKKARDESG